MIRADYKATAVHTDLNLHAKIVENRVEVRAANDPKGSFMLQFPGTPTDVAFDRNFCYVLQKAGSDVLLYQLTPYGFLLAEFHVASGPAKQPRLAFAKVAASHFVIVHIQQIVYVFDSEWKKQTLTCGSQVLQVLDFSDRLLVKLVGKKCAVFKQKEGTNHLVYEKQFKTKGEYLMKQDDYLLCDDGSAIGINFAETECSLSFRKVEAHRIWAINAGNCTQHLVETSLRYFLKHSLFGTPISFETKIIEKFQVIAHLRLIYKGAKHQIDQVLGFAGVADAEEIIDFDVYGNLVICQVLWHSEYHLIAADSLQQQGILLQSCDTRLGFYKGDREYTSVQNLKEKLVYFSQFDLYQNGQIRYSYDQPIIEVCPTDNDEFYVLTEFQGCTKIYLRYEIVFQGAAKMTSLAVPLTDFLVAADGQQIYYFFLGLQAQECFEITKQERLSTKAGVIYIISRFGARKLCSPVYELTKQVQQVWGSGQPAEIRICPHFVDQSLLLALFDRVISSSSGMSDSAAHSIAIAALRMLSPYNFARKAAEFSDFALSGMGQLALDQFKGADDFSKVLLFRTLQARLQFEAFKSLHIPVNSVDLNQDFLLSMLTVVYQQRNIRLFLLLALQAGFRVSSILHFLCDEYSVLRRRCRGFLRALTRKIRVVSLATVQCITFDQMCLKEYLIAFYDILGLNPVNQLVQTLQQTEPSRVRVLSTKDFCALRISLSASRYFSQFTDCFASSRECAFEDSGIRYTYVAPDSGQSLSQAGQPMEIADDDDWGQSERRVRKFKIKTRD